MRPTSMLLAIAVALSCQGAIAQSYSSSWNRVGNTYVGRYTFNGRTTVCRTYIGKYSGSTYCSEEGYGSQPQSQREKAEICGLIMQNPEWPKHMDAITATCLSLTEEERLRYKVAPETYAKIEARIVADREEAERNPKLSTFEQRMCELEGKYCKGIAAWNAEEAAKAKASPAQ